MTGAWGKRIDQIELTPPWKGAQRITAERGVIATAYERKSGAFGAIGALFPYVLPPRTWSAARQIEKMRVEGYRDGGILSYRLMF